MPTDLQQLDHLCLPEEIETRFRALAENIGVTHRALGRVVDEYMQDLPHGGHMAGYGLFADLYRQVTGETISPRTIRAWRYAAITFSKHDLEQFEQLSDSQLVTAVELSEIANIEPKVICEWAVKTGCASVPAMRANWLPPTGDDAMTDPPAISAMVRAGKSRYWSARPELLAEWHALIEQARRIWREIMTA
jgi:hypothetical protein